MPGNDANTKLLIHANGGDGVKSAFAHIKCNDNAASTTVTDDGTGANSFTASTNTSNLSVAGKISNAFDFNGTTEYVNLDSLVTDIASDTVGSMSCWVNATSLATSANFYSISHGAGANEYIFIGITTTGRIWAWCYKANVMQWYIQTDASAHTTGVWYHVVLTQDGVTPKLYIDGSISNSVVAGADVTAWFNDLTNIDKARLGAINYSDSTEHLYLSGKLDDVRYFKCALSQTEIDYLYNSGSGTENSIIIDSAVGGTPQTAIQTFADAQLDSTAAFCHMDLEDNTDRGTGANAVSDIGTPTYTSGKLNNALTLDGSTDALNLDAFEADVATDTTGSFSLWVKPNAEASFSYAFTLSNSAAETYFGMEYSGGSNDHMAFYLSSAGTDKFYVRASTSSVPDDGTTWTHIAFVQDGTAPKIYINGVEDTTNITTTDLTAWFNDMATPNSARIGCRIKNGAGNDRFFDGQIDDFRYYQNYVLSQNEILSIYNSGDGTTRNASDYKWGTNSLKFDGTGDYVSIPDSADWDLAADKTSIKTIDLQYLNNASGTTQQLIAQDQDASNVWVVYQESSTFGNRFRLQYYIGATTILDLQRQMATASSTGVFNHVALIKNGTFYGIYVNGNQEVYGAYLESFNLSGPLLLSRNGSVNGNIDEFRIQADNYFSAAPNSFPAAPLLLYGDTYTNVGYGDTPAKEYGTAGPLPIEYAHYKLNDNAASTDVIDSSYHEVTPASSTLSQSGLSAFSAANTVDGSTTTQGFHCDSAGIGSWLKIDLGVGNSAAYTAARFYTASGVVTANWQVEWSDNDSDWNDTGGDIDISAGNNLWHWGTWANAGAHRYWRFYKTNSNAVGGYVMELEMYSGANNGTASANTSTLTTTAKVGTGAFDFDGSSNVNIDALEVDIDSDTAGTFALWFKVTSASGGGLQTMLSISDTSAARLFRIAVNNTGKLYSYLIGAPNYWVMETTATVPDATWTHVVITHDGVSPKMYMNGSDVTNITSGSDYTAWLSTEETLLDNGRIGNAYYSSSEQDYFTGQIDDVRYYKNQALAPFQIANIYNEGTGSEAALDALYFDGNSDYLTVTDTSGTDYDIVGSLTDSWTIDFWAKTDGASSSEIVLWQASGGTGNDAWYIEYDSAEKYKIIAYKEPGTNILPATATASVTDLGWHHIAFVKQGAHWGAYLDGVQQGYGLQTNTVTVTDSLYIGSTDTPSLYFGGYIEQLQITKGNKFGVSPVKEPYTQYKLNDNAASTTVVDSGSGANNGTVTGGSNTADISGAGKINEALELVSPDYIAAANLATDIASDTSGTVSMWVNLNALGYNTFLCVSNNAANTRMEFWRNPVPSRVEAALINVGSAKWTIRTSSDISASTWIHVALVQDGTSPKLYINGVQDTNIIGSADLTAWFTDMTSVNRANIGLREYNGSSGDYLNGFVDDFRYYQNTALTEAQVWSIYNAGTGTEEWTEATVPTAVLTQDTITPPTAEYAPPAQGRSQAIIIA